MQTRYFIYEQWTCIPCIFLNMNINLCLENDRIETLSWQWRRCAEAGVRRETATLYPLSSAACPELATVWSPRPWLPRQGVLHSAPLSAVYTGTRPHLNISSTRSCWIHLNPQLTKHSGLPCFLSLAKWSILISHLIIMRMQLNSEILHLKFQAWSIHLF